MSTYKQYSKEKFAVDLLLAWEKNLLDNIHCNSQSKGNGKTLSRKLEGGEGRVV